MPSFSKSRMQASAWGAKASLSSTWSTASPLRPALTSAFFTAGTGPQPMICGSQAATPPPARRASGFAPCFAASFSLPITIAAAPSTTALALAAVIVPPGSNAGPSRDIFASETSSRMWGSLFTATASPPPSRRVGSHSGEDHLHAPRHGLGAAPADPGDGQRGHVVAEPAAPAHPLGAVDRVAVAVRGHPHHHAADERLVDGGGRERAADRHPPELGRGEAGEEPGGPVVLQDVGAGRAAGAVEDDDRLTTRHGVLPSLVEELRRHARAVLDEVLHADVVVDGALARAEAFRLHPHPLRERPGEAAAEHTHQDRVDRQRGVAELAERQRP